MTAQPTRIVAGLLGLFSLAIAAGVVSAVQWGDSSGSIPHRVIARQAQVSGALGPNTTLHTVVLVNRSPQQGALDDAPAKTRSEGWWAFDATGKLRAYYGATYDLTGTILVETQIMGADGTLTFTEYPSGETHRFKNNKLTAAVVADGLNAAAKAAQAQLAAPGAAATYKLTNGGEYIIPMPHERDYIDPETYMLVKRDDLTLDGSAILETSEFPTLEVLEGDAVPAPPVVTVTIVPPTEFLAATPTP